LTLGDDRAATRTLHSPIRPEKSSIDNRLKSERSGACRSIRRRSFTVDRYAHVLPGMQERAAGKLEAILFVG
jgi:hypothetical protein